LVSDASYKPIFLKDYRLDVPFTAELQAAECLRILDEQGLLAFEGENTLVLDTDAVIAVPDDFHRNEDDRFLLEKAAALKEEDQVLSRKVEERKLHFLFALPPALQKLKDTWKKAQVLHSQECLLSLADQVQASDHQRGFILAEVQPGTLNILAIKEDNLQIINRQALNDPSDFIYHTLNTMRQLDLDRSQFPVYLTGCVHKDHELYGLLGKYIRNIKTTPYYLEELNKAQISKYMVLSEASKCV